MKARKFYHNLRFKVTLVLLLSLTAVLAVTTLIGYGSLRRLLAESLDRPLARTQDSVQAQLAVYLRYGLVLVVSSIIAIVLVTELLLSRTVIGRLREFVRAVKDAGQGNLDARAPAGGRDEISELAEAFNQMADELQRRDAELATLNALAGTVSQSIELEAVLHSALDDILELTKLEAGWITLRGKHDSEPVASGRPPYEMSAKERGVASARSAQRLPIAGDAFILAASRGLSEEATRAHTRCNWDRCICSGVFESGLAQVFRLEARHLCPAGEYLHQRGLVCRACVPLKSKDRVLGVMSLAGAASNSMWMFTQSAQSMLSAVGRQIGVAIENASLYEEQRQSEMLRRQLMERGIELQEEERRRIARELHDQTSQRLTSVLMTLGALGEVESLDEVQAYVSDLRTVVARTLEEVHDLALELRPRLLDDLGLVAALRHYLGEFRDRFHLLTDLQVVGLDDERLPSRVKTALYRIAQQALVNVARHARAESVGVLLGDRGSSVVLIVEDDGVGFDVEEVMGSHVLQTNLGLYGMRERASLLGGSLTIESAPGGGTSVFVEIPLQREGLVDGQDTAASG
jgi:signal transduction histidine kinase/HAMP domain-containing protein